MQKKEFVLRVVCCAFSAASEREAARLVERQLKLSGSKSVRAVVDFDVNPRVICVEHPELGWLEYSKSEDGEAVLKSHDPQHKGVAA